MFSDNLLQKFSIASIAYWSKTGKVKIVFKKIPISHVFNHNLLQKSMLLCKEMFHSTSCIHCIVNQCHLVKVDSTCLQ